MDGSEHITFQFIGNVMFNVVTIILIGVSIDMHYILEGYELTHTLLTLFEGQSSSVTNVHLTW